MRKILYGILLSCILILIPNEVFAANVAKIGETEYETFAEALTNVEEGGKITLISDITMTPVVINKDVIIDLNNYTISATRQTFTVQNASFELIGPGKVEETEPWFSPIVVKGSAVATDTNYTVVTIGKDVELVGYYGIMIDKSGYGVVVNVNGNLKGVNDGSSNGTGLYINGTIKDKTNYPIININKGSKLEADGVGIYAAGYAEWNLNDVTITAPTGIGIKAGKLNITGGTVTATGDDDTPTDPYSNGINESSTAIQVESNASYAGDIEISLKNTEIVSQKSYTFYEYGNTEESYLTKLSFDNVVFKAGLRFGAFGVSDKFEVRGFLKAGRYAGYHRDMIYYVADGYKGSYDAEDRVFVVTKATIPTGNRTISGTITGTITDATITLMQGGTVIKSLALTNNTYSISDVAPGIYNLVVKREDKSLTKAIEVQDKDVVFDFTMPNYQSDFIFLGGENAPNIVVNGLDKASESNDFSLAAFAFDEYDEEIVIFLGQPEVKDEILAIENLAKGKDFSFIVIDLVNEDVADFDPLEIIVPYDLAKNKNTVIYRYHNNKAEAFEKLDARPSDEYKDGTYYLDTKNNLIYIYTNGFSIYAIGSDKVDNPSTSDNIMLYVGLGVAAIVGAVVLLSVKKRNNKKA